MTNLRKTAAGQLLNMDQLRIKHEKEVAVGNMNANARGDEISKDGSIIRTKNELMKEHYRGSK